MKSGVRHALRAYLLRGDQPEAGHGDIVVLLASDAGDEMLRLTPAGRVKALRPVPLQSFLLRGARMVRGEVVVHNVEELQAALKRLLVS